MLSKDQKKIILEYILEDGSFSKGILESTPIGDAYEEGTVTSDDIYEYILAVKQRELQFLEGIK